MQTKTLLSFALAMLLPATAQAARTATKEAPDAVLAARMDAAIDRAIAERRIVGTVVLVARDGRLVYHRAAGLADREAKRPMREDAIFRLASVSKPYVTAAAMRLVERGVIALDDPVTRWLPAFRPTLSDGTRPAITVRQLMTHTAGLGYGFEEPGETGPYHRLGVSDGMDVAGFTLDANLARLAQAPLLFAPGSAWRYSLGIDVLGAVLEKATGQPLDEVVRREVTGPLDLGDTGFAVTDRARLAVPYADGRRGPVKMTDGIAVPIEGGAIRFAPSRATDPAAYPSGGAGMVGTARDLLAFLEAIRTGGAPILSRASVAAMARDQVGAQAATQGPGWGFGYGWAVLDDPAAAATPQSAGTLQWGGAYGHSWFVDPARRLTVVALTNTAFEGMSGRFVTDIRNAAYDRQAR